MATIRGCFGIVLAGGSDTNVGEIRTWEYTESAQRIDASVMGNCTKKFVAGAKETTGRITAWWNLGPGTDPTQDAGQALLTVGASVALKLHPNGTGSGKPELSGTVTITEVGASADVDGIVQANFGFALDGEWTQAAQV